MVRAFSCRADRQTDRQTDRQSNSKSASECVQTENTSTYTVRVLMLYTKMGACMHGAYDEHMYDTHRYTLTRHNITQHTTTHHFWFESPGSVNDFSGLLHVYVLETFSKTVLQGLNHHTWQTSKRTYMHAGMRSACQSVSQPVCLSVCRPRGRTFLPPTSTDRPS